jgi:hypothetical protein
MRIRGASGAPGRTGSGGAASASSSSVMWSAAVLLRVARPQQPGQALPVADLRPVQDRQQRWNPNVFFHVAAAYFF